MYCKMCGTKNKNKSNFCYKCGHQLKTKINTSKIILNKYQNKSINFFNGKINSAINSSGDNKYQKIFILTSIITISFVIFMYVLFSTPDALYLAVSSITSEKISIKISHRLWRDIWFRLIFIIISAFSFCISAFALINISVKNSKKKGK